MHPSKYLIQDEVTQLDQAFETSLQHDSALVFWTGISPVVAKDWAWRNNMKTLTMAMGSLYSDDSQGSVKSQKSTKSWSKYMKGASGVFALQACHDRHAVVLTNAPPNIYSTREHSNYRDIEEPILMGIETGRHATQIDYVHPTVPGAACFRYQIWPDNRSSEWFGFLERINLRDIFKQVVQCTNPQRSRTTQDSRYPKQSESVDSIALATSATGGRNRVSKILQGDSSVEQDIVERERQAARGRTAANSFKMESQQRAAQEKKAAKRLKVERQQEAVREKKAAKRLKMERQEQAAQKKKAAKRLKVERQQEAAREKKAAKRLKMERQEQAAQETKAAKRLKMERQEQAAQEKKAAAKRLKMERQQQAAQEKKAAKRLKAEREEQAARDKKAAKSFKAKALGVVISI